MTTPNTTRNQKIVELRNRQRPLTFKQIGDKFGITRQRAHQIYKQEIEKITQRMTLR